MKKLQAKRARVMREIEALREKDGTFKDEATRATAESKIAEVEAIDEQIRAAETEAPEEEPAVSAEARAAIITEERTRVDGITTAVRVAKLDAAMATDMIKRGITLDAARSEIFAKLAEQDSKTQTSNVVVIGEDAQDKFLRGSANWLLVKGGMADIVARAENPSAPNVRAIDPGEFRGMTLMDLARYTLDRRGRKVAGLDKMRIVADALTTRGDITQSTSDFATLLENVMHKVLQAAYAIQPDTWRRFCAQSTVSDFRAHNRYRMGTFSALDSLTETGEFKNTAITDAEKATITASTKGNIINVSRKMIVNDDMSAFSRLLSMLGRAAALSIEVDIYALLAQNAGLGPTLDDGIVLFNASHNNISTGAAISAAAIDADRVEMAKQKDKNSNDFLDLRPAVLLVPVGLGGQARIINVSQFDPDTVANKSQMKPNIVAGLFRDVVDTPRFSGTRRYLFADPNIAPVMEVAFLEGQTSPMLETQDGWRVDGAEMKVRFDYGTAAVDFRGAVTNAGV